MKISELFSLIDFDTTIIGNKHEDDIYIFEVQYNHNYHESFVSVTWKKNHKYGLYESTLFEDSYKKHDEYQQKLKNHLYNYLLNHRNRKIKIFLNEN